MPEITFRDIQIGLRDLGLNRESRVIAHASMAALGAVRGGAETVAGALVAACRLVVMPAFTLHCRVWPLVGPLNNGTSYRGHDAENASAEIFRPDLPVHPSLGPVAQALRHVPGASRSGHPLYSFTAVGPEAGRVVAAQSLADPLGPIAHLAEAEPDAEVLLLGLDHTANFSLHYAEQRAGRKQFVRWALTSQGAVECPGCPGCADGFNALVPHLGRLSQVAQIGHARVERIRLAPLLALVADLLRRDPRALLCTRTGCERCDAVRSVAAATALTGAALAA